MKYPALLRFDEIVSQLDDFDAIIDVRSPSEYAEDRIPGAINCPVLNDEERVRVGTLYKQVDPFYAKKIGASLVARNIAQHIDASFADKPRDWKPLIYCWRGGNRSGSMAHVLARIGWPAVQLEGGYKEYRRYVNEALDALPNQFQFCVICGTTGSGKSRLLQTLARMGAQVLDLEQLAAHRGSVLGNLPTEAQPSQKSFDSAIWNTLRRLDPNRVIFVESESKKVGNLRVPDALMSHMRESPCVSLVLTQQLRIQLLMQDYIHFIESPQSLQTQLERLVPLHGRERVSAWQEMASNGQMEMLVDELLVRHYDPAYIRSIDRNFKQFHLAQQVTLPDVSDAAFEDAARKLIDTQVASPIPGN